MANRGNLTTFETATSLPAQGVIGRAKIFFAGRVPGTAAFVEKEASGVVVLRGQGGEEIVIAARSDGAGATKVRGSSLLFGQQVKRFFTTLPPVVRAEAA
jgi:hypothetical protein